MESAPGVADIRLMEVALGSWLSQIPADEERGEPASESIRAIAVIGIEPERPALNLPEVREQWRTLEFPGYALIDRKSRPEFAPLNRREFGPQDIGRSSDMMGKKMTIGGTYSLGTGLAASGAVIVSRRNFAQYFTTYENQVSLILVNCDAGVSPDRLASSIQKSLEAAGYRDVAEVLTRDKVFSKERGLWVYHTPIGLIFNSGVALAAIVGAMICYMVLATDVMGRLPEYATLKAMGYTNLYLALVVMQQAWWLAGIAVVITTPVAMFVYQITSYLAGVDIIMTVPRVILVCLLTMGACSFAALAALRKLANAEPASLF